MTPVTTPTELRLAKRMARLGTETAFETLAKARAAWKSAKNLAASNDDVMTAELAKRLQHADEELHADEAEVVRPLFRPQGRCLPR